ncbi:MAG: transglycosylase SLT domain-containing protein [Candidatus Aenigmatarchaeota archaeon]
MNSKLAISIAVCVILLSSSLAYAEEGMDFFTWLWGLFGSQEPAVSVQGNQAQTNGCSQQCGQDCNLEKCVNQDGCLWNKGNCDNICTPGMAKEIVVIKRYESCSNAQNCNDVYLCENGVTGNPISAAFSAVPKSTSNSKPDSAGSDSPDIIESGDAVLVDSDFSVNPDYVPSGSEAVSCSNLPASFVAGYNQYSGTIKNAADNYLRSSGIDNPEALIAGIISQESAWKSNAVSQCASAGIAQFISKTARDYGLYVPQTPGEYEWAYCRIGTEKCKLANSAGVLVETKVSSCNACTPSNCKWKEDERFNPEKSIRALANHVKDLMNRCGSLDGAIKAYNSGSCLSEANTGYLSKVKSYYLKWKSCLGRQPAITQTQNPVASSQTNSDSQYIGQSCASPEGYEGACQYATASRCTFYDNRCPGSSAVKCCVSDDNFIGDQCTAPNGARGTCQYVGTSGCTFYAGRCPGTADVKCCILSSSSTGYVTASVTGMDTSSASVSPDQTQTDLAYLDTMLNQNQQSSVLQEGQYTVSEKIIIQDNDGDFIFTDDSSNIVNPHCNIDPINTGVRDYWIGLTDNDVCIGMHGVALAEHDCGNTVKSEEIKNIFENIQTGTTVTVKDPYDSRATETSGNAGDLKSGTLSKTCSNVCSDMWSYLTRILDNSECTSRCNKLGCAWENDKCVSAPSMCTTSQGMCEVVAEDDFNSEYFTPIEDSTITGYATYPSAPANEVVSENPESSTSTISTGLSLNLFVVNPYAKVRNERTNKIWFVRLYDANRNAIANGLQNSVHKLSTVIKGDIPETGLPAADVLFITGHHFTSDHYIWGDRLTSSGIRDTTQKQNIEFLELPYSEKTKAILVSSCHTVMNPDFKEGESVPILREFLEKNPNLVLVAGFETAAPLLDDGRMRSSTKEVLNTLSSGNVRGAAAAWVNSIKATNKGRAWRDKNSYGSWNYGGSENGFSGAAFFKEDGKWYYTASSHDPQEINISSNQYTNRQNEENLVDNTKCGADDLFNENAGQIRCIHNGRAGRRAGYDKVQCLPSTYGYEWTKIQSGFTSQDSCASACKDNANSASYCTEPRLVVWATQNGKTILDKQTGIELSNDIIIKAKNENPHQNKLRMYEYRIIYSTIDQFGRGSFSNSCDLTTTDCELRIPKKSLKEWNTVEYWSEMTILESSDTYSLIKASAFPDYHRRYKYFTIRTNPSG